MIRLQNIDKEYHLDKTIVVALRSISLEIEPGEFTVVAGPSGSGKTTLLNLIGCLDRPTRGAVFIDGQDTAPLDDLSLSRLRAKKIGFIFQNFNLIPVLTTFENVEYPLLLNRQKNHREIVEQMLVAVGLQDHLRHRPEELSGGQRQRVAIARALITKPQLVLADEPTANLDSSTGEKIIELMQTLNARYKTTFVCSSHDPMVVAYARRVVHLRDGHIEKIA